MPRHPKSAQGIQLIDANPLLFEENVSNNSIFSNENKMDEMELSNHHTPLIFTPPTNDDPTKGASRY